MNESRQSLLRLIRLCVVEERSGPWKDLLAAIAPRIESAFRLRGGRTADLEEFTAWFGSWLFSCCKFRLLLRRLNEKIAAGECESAASEEQFADNYLYQIARSGVGQFYRDSHSRESVTDPSQFENTGVENLARGRSLGPSLILIERIEEALATLPEGIRVPLRLRFYRLLKPLSEAEVQWIAAQGAVEAAAVNQLVEGEFESNFDAKYPLSAEFISRLLAMPPAADGEYKAIDQRVSRAMRELKRILGGEDNE